MSTHCNDGCDCILCNRAAVPHLRLVHSVDKPEVEVAKPQPAADDPVEQTRAGIRQMYEELSAISAGFDATTNSVQRFMHGIWRKRLERFERIFERQVKEARKAERGGER